MKGLCPFAALANAAKAVVLSEPALRTLDTCLYYVCCKGEGNASQLACAGGHWPPSCIHHFIPNHLVHIRGYEKVLSPRIYFLISGIAPGGRVGALATVHSGGS